LRDGLAGGSVKKSPNDGPAGGELAYRRFPLPDTNRAAGLLPRMARLAVDPHDRILF